MSNLLKLLFFLLPHGFAFAAVDLSIEFEGAQKSAQGEQWDGSHVLPEVPLQSPLGACQSFAMAAWLEYLFFYQTGQRIDLSEKHLAFQLLDYMIDEFYDEQLGYQQNSYLGKNYLSTQPNLGSGIAPFMLESYFASGVLPDANYSFGDMTQASGSVLLDIPRYQATFESLTDLNDPVEYREALKETFLSNPPEHIYFQYQRFSFATGKTEDVILRSALDIRDSINLSNQNVQTLYNSDIDLSGEEDLKDVIRFFHQVSQAKNHRSRLVGTEEMKSEIVKSLRNRRAVMVASHVWVDSWADGFVGVMGGGHATVIIGYQVRENDVFFKIRNSWGADRLASGYNYISAKKLLPTIYYSVFMDADK